MTIAGNRTSSGGGRAGLGYRVGCLSVCLLLLSGGALATDESDLVVEIWKSKRRMELRAGGEVVREFEVAFGQIPDGAKQHVGDKRTPVGEYFISEKHTSPRFHRFLGISYPNIYDADKGYRDGLITAGQWADLFIATASRRSPPSTTALGGRIGIHGYGHRPYMPVIDWTDGCIAVSNEEAEYLFATVPVGTPVRIFE